MTKEQAFDNMIYGTYDEMNAAREQLKDYFNGDSTKQHLFAYMDLKECGICGHVDLEENMHENEDGIYCDCCWEAR